MVIYSQSKKLGAPAQTRLSARDSERVRGLIREGKAEFGLLTEDLAKVAVRLEVARSRAKIADLETVGARQSLIQIAARTVYPKDEDVVRLKQRIDDAMTKSKDRGRRPGMLRRTAALLALTILWRTIERTASGELEIPWTNGPATTDAWGHRAEDLYAELDFGPLEVEAGILPPDVPTALIPRRAIDALTALFERELKREAVRSSVRSQAATVLRRILRSNARQMATKWSVAVLGLLAQSGLNTRRSANVSPSQVVRLILDAMMPTD